MFLLLSINLYENTTKARSARDLKKRTLKEILAKAFKVRQATHQASAKSEVSTSTLHFTSVSHADEVKVCIS